MRKKAMVGLIAIVAIVAAVIFAGCIEEETPVSIPTPTPVSPTSSFEIEYPVTAYFWAAQGAAAQVTLYEDGTAFTKHTLEGVEATGYGEWEIMEKTTSLIAYRFEFNYSTTDFTGSGVMYFALFSNHSAIVPHEAAGYWSE